MNIGPSLNRRDFIGAAAGSLVVGFPLHAMAQGTAPEINAWVVVQPDERVIIRIARSEMGQGTLTGLAQLVAEELDCDWARSAPSTRRPARTWRATASGATSPPAAAAASASRRTTCARVAPPPAPCWCRPPPTSGR
jgi:CO/xanthine dehydrogenase Mo-binding subunit